MTADQPHPDIIGHFLKAMFGGPTVSDGSAATSSYVHTVAAEHEEMSPCPACGTRFDDCDASQPYADEEDQPCCEACEHEWVPPPPAYTIVSASAYETYMTEIGLGRHQGH